MGVCFTQSPGGRPPELTDELTEKICNLLRMGNYIETAVVVSGVSKEVFYLWCKIANGKQKKEIRSGKRKGEKIPYTEKEKEPYVKFLHSVTRAIEECDARDLANIDQAASGRDVVYERDEEGKIVMAGGKPVVKRYGISPDWHASAWRMHRRRPNRWNDSPTERIDQIVDPSDPSSGAKKPQVETETEKEKRIEAQFAEFSEIFGTD